MRDRNYIAAYQYIKMTRPPEPEFSEHAGELASAIIAELGKTNKREEPDRVVFLRSILAWVFRDIPGLSTLYREQLRGSGGIGDPMSEVYRGVRNLNDMAYGRKSVSEGIEDAFSQIRENVERVADQVRDRYNEYSRGGGARRPEEAGDRPDPVNDLLRSAEKGITQGLKQVGEFFENARRAAEQERNAAQSEDSNVHAEDESGADIRVDIVDEDNESSGSGKKGKGRDK